MNTTTIGQSALKFASPPFDLNTEMERRFGRPLVGEEKWHRKDFTCEDLEGGWRPFLHGETGTEKDEHLGRIWETEHASQFYYPAGRGCKKARTKRPLPIPAPDKDGWICHDGLQVPTGFADDDLIEADNKTGRLWIRSFSVWVTKPNSFIKAENSTYTILCYRSVPKPEPKFVPYTRETCPPLPFEAVRKDNKNRLVVVGANDRGCRIGGSCEILFWDDLLEDCVHSNGTPCGTEVK